MVLKSASPIAAITIVEVAIVALLIGDNKDAVPTDTCTNALTQLNIGAVKPNLLAAAGGATIPASNVSVVTLLGYSHSELVTANSQTCITRMAGEVACFTTVTESGVAGILVAGKALGNSRTVDVTPRSVRVEDIDAFASSALC